MEKLKHETLYILSILVTTFVSLLKLHIQCGKSALTTSKCFQRRWNQHKMPKARRNCMHLQHFFFFLYGWNSCHMNILVNHLHPPPTPPKQKHEKGVGDKIRIPLKISFGFHNKFGCPSSKSWYRIRQRHALCRFKRLPVRVSCELELIIIFCKVPRW